MSGVLATVSVEGFHYEWKIYLVAQGLTHLLFLFGAVRMYQARKAVHWVRLGWGFGLMLAVLIGDEVVESGLVVMNYWPGMGAHTSYAYEVVEVGWWEPWLWWGSWVLSLCGQALVALGFFGAAREMVGTALFGARGRKRKEAR